MKIDVISPILAPAEGHDWREGFRRRDCASVPAEFRFFYIDNGPRFIQNAYDDAHAAPALLRRVQRCAAEGAQAIVINCSADTALRACREAVRIPVIGPSECTMLYAPQLVDSFAVLTFASRINSRFTRIAHELGLSHRLANVISVETGFDALSGGSDAVAQSLYDAIVSERERSGCEGFILGCTDFEDVAPQLSALLEKNNVPAVILKPFEISAWTAYITVQMKLAQGSGSYPAPLFPLE